MTTGGKWVCIPNFFSREGGCGYVALSTPVRSDGVDECPRCGGSWWSPLKATTFGDFKNDVRVSGEGP